MKHFFPDIRTHSFRDRLFHIHWRRWRRSADELPEKNMGRCDHRESSHPDMHIYPHQEPLELLGTVTHEAIHASFSDISDDAVEEFERDWLRFLRRMKIKVSFGDE